MNNPWAMRKIIEKLIEAYERRYWQTNNNTIAELRKLLERTNNNISDQEIIISRAK